VGADAQDECSTCPPPQQLPRGLPGSVAPSLTKLANLRTTCTRSPRS